MRERRIDPAEDFDFPDNIPVVELTIENPSGFVLEGPGPGATVEEELVVGGSLEVDPVAMDVAPVPVSNKPKSSLLTLLAGPCSLLFLGSTATYAVCICIIVAIFDRSKRCAASTAETIAPSRAEKSHTSSVTKNFRAKLKNAEGPFDALTAMTCLGFGDGGPPWSARCSVECSDAIPADAASDSIDMTISWHGDDTRSLRLMYVLAVMPVTCVRPVEDHWKLLLNLNFRKLVVKVER